MKELYWGKKKSKTIELDTSSENNQTITVDNHIYFYSEVERCKMLELNKAIRELDTKLTKRCFIYFYSFTKNLFTY